MPATAQVREPRGTILVAEDDELTLATVTGVLTRLGYRVLGATSVAEALRAAASADVDLAILDIGLPDGSGFDLSRTLQAGVVPVPVIFLTGQRSDEAVQLAAAAGGLSYMVKPITRESLDHLVPTIRCAIVRGQRDRLDAMEKHKVREAVSKAAHRYLAEGVLMVLEGLDREEAHTRMTQMCRSSQLGIIDCAELLLQAVERRNREAEPYHEAERALRAVLEKAGGATVCPSGAGRRGGRRRSGPGA
jgi:DNA-binding response OmpR family regulator